MIEIPCAICYGMLPQDQLRDNMCIDCHADEVMRLRRERDEFKALLYELREEQRHAGIEKDLST